MFGIHNYASFVAAIVAFQIIPGPGTLTILNATARHGVRSGMGAGQRHSIHFAHGRWQGIPSAALRPHFAAAKRILCDRL
jgi:hypothetical protein